MLTKEQSEVLQLLSQDIETLVAENLECLEQEDFQSHADVIREHIVHLGHIANALDMAGLNGLSFCARQLASIFDHLITHRQSPPTELELPLKDWGRYFLAYLCDIENTEQEQNDIHQLLKLLSQSALPCHFSEAQKKQAEEFFNVSDLSVINEEAALPESVSEAMASLEIPADARSELLHGMLLELPGQVRQFEKSISDFLASGEFEDLKQAQRIAHTIKGAANVVSIAGMANLTHFAEDLLETAAKRLRHNSREFEDLLVETSDSLAAAAEYLNNEGPAPTDLRAVMENLLRWLNTLKHDEELSEPHTGNKAPLDTQSDITRAAEHIEADHVSEGVSETEEIAEQEKNERYINAPESTAQELLRLSGEMQIANNQVAAQLDTVEHSMALTDRYHRQIKAMAAELESLVQTQSALRAASRKHEHSEFDPLEMEQFNELHTFSHRLLELTTDSYETITNVDDQLKELLNLNRHQKQLNKSNQSILLEMNLVPVASLSARFARCVRQTARLTGKLARLNIHGESLMMDSRVLSRVADPIMHVLRNAVDHGLPFLDEQEGEFREGVIDLSFSNQGDTIEIRCEDHGQGLDFDSIRATAVARGLLDPEVDITPQMLSQLILMPGFSTRESASHTSGRGIGLDSVLAEVRALKGNLTINSQTDQGCVVVMTVPTSILTSHALLVEARDRQRLLTYAIASRGIQQVIYVDETDLQFHQQQLMYNYHDELIPVQGLGQLLGTLALEKENITALLISEKKDGALIAIAVERVTASQDLVIKPLNKYSYNAPGVIGATILGDGMVSPVIDLQSLPGMSLSQGELATLAEQRRRLIEEEKARYVAPPAALIVDDSLSVRRSLAQFVLDMGMEAYTAKDGFDAISMMEEHKPSLMLVDLEMPRMNGLELTAHIRSREEYKDIPVIMITSRSTTKHREMAKSAGVSGYLTKPWSDDELMNCISREIA